MSQSIKHDENEMAATNSEHPAALLRSTELFMQSNTIRIEHGDDIYFLRLTRANKLILTK